jgi:hypothetical protein
VEKEVAEFDFERTNEHLRGMGLPELEENPLEAPGNAGPPCSCPGASVREVGGAKEAALGGASALGQWPVQMRLVPPNAPFLDNSHLLVAADCAPFACPDFHSKLLSGKTLVIACPKLDDLDAHIEKLSAIFRANRIKSVTVAIMEVPCCGGLEYAAREAVKRSGKEIPVIVEVLGIDGKIQ